MSISNPRLLRSWPTFDTPPKRLQETAEVEVKSGKVYLAGILQKANTLNQNGRIYPKSILEREVQNYQKYIIERRALGELDHPESSVVSLQNACHNLVEVWMENDIVYGKSQILNTPSGKILQDLIEDEIKLGISSRGVGSTAQDDDYYVVQDDFQLICWDYVSEPSTPGAFMLLPEHAAFSPQGKEIPIQLFNERFAKQQLINKTSNIIDELLQMKEGRE